MQQRGRGVCGIMEWMNRTMKHCGAKWLVPVRLLCASSVAGPWVHNLTATPTWHQAAAVIICARVERLHGMLLAITPVYMEGGYWGGGGVR